MGTELTKKTPSEIRAEKAALRERTILKLSEPDLLTDIAAHVANGGSLIGLCQVWDIRYSDVVVWIYKKDHPERQELYENAMKAGTEWAFNRVLDEVKALGFTDLADAYDESGNLKDVQQMPANLRAAIAGIDVTEEFSGRGESREKIGYTKKLKLFDKLKALELLGKQLGMFADRLNVKIGLSLEQLVDGSREKPKTVVEVEAHGVDSGTISEPGPTEL